MSSIHFNIENWLAVSNCLQGDEQWFTWVSGSKRCREISERLPVDKIPAISRRRMSLLSKIAIQTALSITKGNDIDYIIFSSRHGELHRTVDLLSEILEGNDASPMAFSQSVHNTAAGLYTILTKQQVPVTSLAAGEHCLHSALIEAAAFLFENPNSKVLVVDFDQPTPTPYESFDVGCPETYSLGLIISCGEKYQLSWKPTTTPCTTSLNVKSSQTLDVIKNLVCNNSYWHIDGFRKSWNWKCIAV